MRVVVLGGTRFIGRAIVEELVAAGHEPLVVHRGRSEPAGLPPVRHLHVDRRDLPGARAEIAGFEPDAAVDAYAMTREDAEAALAALPAGLRLVVLSSADVYRAFASLHEGAVTDAVPLDEGAPVRSERYPYRGKDVELPDPEVDRDRYEKLDVEDAYRPRGATVLRLPFVYGEHDPARREEIVLRRVRHGRRRIPVGPGAFLGSRAYVRDVAAATRRALETPAAAGATLNVAERRTWPVRLWMERVLRAAGSDARLVAVPEDALPPDLLDWTGDNPQPLLLDSARARALAVLSETDPDEALRRSVGWHLANPPPGDDGDFAADDAALERAFAAPAAG